MIVMLSAVFLLGIGLAVYAFLPGKHEPDKKNADGSLPLHLSADSGLNNQASNAELERLKAENKNLQAELELARNTVKALKEEIDKSGPSDAGVEALKEELQAKKQELERLFSQESNFNSELAGSRESLESLTRENKQLLEKVAALDQQVLAYKKESTDKQQHAADLVPKKDYDELNNKLSEALAKVKAGESRVKESSDAAGKLKDLEKLNSQFNEQAGKLEAVNKDNADLASKIRLLEMQIVEYKKEEIMLKAALQEHENTKASQVPKEQYDQLTIKLAEETGRLSALKKENSDLLDKLKILETQAKPQTLPEDPVAKKEHEELKKAYEELKKKLQEAEEVLKIMHGAGE